MENCLLRAGSKASAVSRFREKLSPANGVQGITANSRKIALLGHVREISEMGGQKMGSNMRPRYIRFRDIHDRDISATTKFNQAIDFQIGIARMAVLENI